MICPIKECCKHKERDVNVLMCNECMANKLMDVKNKLESIKNRHDTIKEAEQRLAMSQSLWMNNYTNNTSSSIYGNWVSSSTTTAL